VIQTQLRQHGNLKSVLLKTGFYIRSRTEPNNESIIIMGAKRVLPTSLDSSGVESLSVREYIGDRLGSLVNLAILDLKPCHLRQVTWY
jgi:hypothetical protein